MIELMKLSQQIWQPETSSHKTGAACHGRAESDPVVCSKFVHHARGPALGYHLNRESHK